MFCATAVPPSTPRAPPSVKSFCTSMMNRARDIPLSYCVRSAELGRRHVGEVVAAGMNLGDEALERDARGARDLPRRLQRECEHRAVGCRQDAAERRCRVARASDPAECGMHGREFATEAVRHWPGHPRDGERRVDGFETGKARGDDGEEPRGLRGVHCALDAEAKTILGDEAVTRNLVVEEG